MPASKKTRKADVTRKTGETDIKIKLGLDGTGKNSIDTGIGFFDHMLSAFSKHGFFDLDCVVKGDLRVDGHHSVEDCGIVLGDAIKKAAGDKRVLTDTAISSFPWMKYWFCAVWIFVTDLISDLNMSTGFP